MGKEWLPLKQLGLITLFVSESLSVILCYLHLKILSVSEDVEVQESERVKSARRTGTFAAAAWRVGPGK